MDRRISSTRHPIIRRLTDNSAFAAVREPGRLRFLAALLLSRIDHR